ncbi:ATPase PAAT isoform X1 [Latimeria chalumnae]|uniref:Chromosome 10 open reading frame 88 n=1 Tax=Latimeria chalumnae TaxID=7897 RepID=H3AJG1_LATCH|nr:PREDICTED: uncharacterized protein C10orf88 homolog isoform X1 [Latimeria chalumnae]|eukprot:XP_006001803.1 PREDICTED: uncharacterized protein C10orf88 homolog isoform X1 [Latimeria chalumnae]
METQVSELCMKKFVSVYSSWECISELTLYDILSVVAADRASKTDDEQDDDGERLVTLKRSVNNDAEAPCVLYLQCAPQGGGIISIEIISEGRTIEVYAGEEYCGTSRGEKGGSVQDNSKNEMVTLCKKYLNLESPTVACELKLLSIGGKKEVIISKIKLGMTTVSVKIPKGLSSFGTNIDLDRVQSMMQSMGTKLSPGAENLMNMVQMQQKQNQIALGGFLHSVLGGRKCKSKHTLMTTAQSTDEAPCISCLEDNLKSQSASHDLNSLIHSHPQSAGTSVELGFSNELGSIKQDLLPADDLKATMFSFLSKQAKEFHNSSGSEMLPFLQNLSSQVNQLRLEDKIKNSENPTIAECPSVKDLWKEPPSCFYFEKIISKQMDLMEKRLMDYIDLRFNKLQDHLDAKLLVVTDLLENSASLKVTKRSYDSGEIFENGEL